jgi:hypothetical protein
VAQEVPIAGAGTSAKIRSPFAPALLPFPTLGIYLFFWWYFINREVQHQADPAVQHLDAGDPPGLLHALERADHGEDRRNDNQRSQRDREHRLAGARPELVRSLCLADMQSGLNSVWKAQATA